MAETANSPDDVRRQGKSAEAFRTISEVAGQLDVPPHVLRFWETRFTQVKPLKRGGGRRYYRPEDVELLRAIRELLYTDGYTIKGVQKLLREGGAKAVSQQARRSDGASEPAAPVAAKPKADPPPSAPGTSGMRDKKIKEIKTIVAELQVLRDTLRRDL